MTADNGFNVEQATLAVLAGGQGTRMGRPKALLQVGEKPLLAWLLDRWRWPGPTMLVTAPGIEQPPESVRFTHRCTDPIAGEGPLRGVLTALEHSRTDQLIITTCDMPCIARPHLTALLAVLGDDRQCAGAMYRRTRDNQPLIEPFPMALRREAIDIVRREFESGNRSPQTLGRDQFRQIDHGWPDTMWTNLNRPDDMSRFLGSLSA